MARKRTYLSVTISARRNADGVDSDEGWHPCKNPACPDKCTGEFCSSQCRREVKAYDTFNLKSETNLQEA